MKVLKLLFWASWAVLGLLMLRNIGLILTYYFFDPPMAFVRWNADIDPVLDPIGWGALAIALTLMLYGFAMDLRSSRSR